MAPSPDCRADYQVSVLENLDSDVLVAFFICLSCHSLELSLLVMCLDHCLLLFTHTD